MSAKSKVPANLTILVACMLIMIAASGHRVLADDLLELTCLSTADCVSYKDKMTAAVCIDNNCECFSIKTNIRQTCNPKVVHKQTKLGDCSQSRCSILHSHCDPTTFKCVCDEGYYSTGDLMRCLKIAVALDQNCEDHEQCYRSDSLSTCQNGTCACIKNAGKFDRRCHSIIESNDFCHSMEECELFSQNALCIQNRCVCMTEYVINEQDNSCVPFVYQRDSCITDSQCRNGLGLGSKCVKNKCQCDDHHELEADLCVVKVFYGDHCSEHSHCTSYHKQVPSMKCQDFKCVCADGFELFDADSKRCVPKAVKPVEVAHGSHTIWWVLGGIVIFVVVAIVFFCKKYVYAPYSRNSA